MMELIDTHIHGGFGINFNTCSLEDFSMFSKNILKRGIVAFCPTLVGDSIFAIRNRLSLIKTFMKNQQNDEAKVLGVHLEGTFLNPKKSGIQNAGSFLTPNIKNFKELAKDNIDIIKIVTIAPELDENSELQKFLEENNIKAHAGHTLSDKLYNVSGTTHHFNAMPPLNHREESVTLKALLDDKIYCEIIGDSKHVSDDMLKLFFKIKNKDKAILVSDALPIAHSKLDSIIFCGKTIYKGGKDKDGTLAGSSMFLDEIAQNLIDKNILTIDDVKLMAYENIIKHLNLENLF